MRKRQRETEANVAQNTILIGRFLVVLAGAIWLGGLVFYASAVIPMAHRVLGSHTTVGFITQQVTSWINVVAVIALVVFLADIFATRAAQRKRLRIIVWATWAVMAAMQASLFILHPMLDRLLDAEALAILDPDRFYTLHQAYLLGTSIQLLAGPVFLACVLAIWRRQDMLEFERRSLHRTRDTPGARNP